MSLGVANPAQVKTPGIYVSMYPNLDRVFEYVKGTLKASRVGFVFSPAKNREIGLQFLKAGSAEGVMVVPVTIASAGDLVRDIKGALPNVDALLLAIDPILFEDPHNLEFIVQEARNANKPTVGFLEELAHLGVTVSLVALPAAAADAAIAAAQPVTIGKKRLEVEGMAVVIAKKTGDGAGGGRGGRMRSADRGAASIALAVLLAASGALRPRPRAGLLRAGQGLLQERDDRGRVETRGSATETPATVTLITATRSSATGSARWPTSSTSPPWATSRWATAATTWRAAGACSCSRTSTRASS